MVSLSEIYTYGQIDINYWEQILVRYHVLEDMHQSTLRIVSENNIRINPNYLKKYDEEIFLNKTMKDYKTFANLKILDTF